MDKFREVKKLARISSSHVSVAVRGILFKKIDGALKNNNFQKKVYQKTFICRGDILLSRAKISDISLKIRKPYQWETNGNRTSRLPICIDFPLVCLRVLSEISDFVSS